jgi:hypothetical protein
MLRICTDAVGFDSPRDLALLVKHAIEGLAYGCVSAYRTWQMPPLYESGVRFAYEPEHGSGNEQFDLPLVVWRRGWGDCDDLVIWRICELVAGGERATCRTYWRHRSLHVAVRRENGDLEDPAVLLGARIGVGR